MADQIQARMQAPAQMKMKRLAYIDWMRGLACVLMFQTHCYDSWLSPEARKSSSLIVWSQLGGTLPAPLFVFLAGVSFALVTERLREKGIERNAIAKQTLLRGAEVFGMGLLFRVQELERAAPSRILPLRAKGSASRWRCVQFPFRADAPSPAQTIRPPRKRRAAPGASRPAATTQSATTISSPPD